MSSLNNRQIDLAQLHPAIRASVENVLKQLQKEKIQLRLFEAYRSPERQRWLYAQGRTREGKIITWVGAWNSFHQYGLAVDFAPFVDGNWTWEHPAIKPGWWTRMHEIGKENGLRPISKELAHLQIAELDVSDLAAGRYPPAGDTSWAENLESHIINWGQGAPPVPRMLPMRPPIPGGAILTDNARHGTEEGGEDATRPVSVQTQQEPRMITTDFNLIQPFIEKWEGGYVNNPHDKGGPTNMGITLATLAAWRGHSVSAGDVQALSRSEARDIFKKRYFDPVRAGELAPQVALMVYNISVLSGQGKAARFLQQALGRINLPVDVDDYVGSQTIGAANQAQAGLLAAEVSNVYEAYLRSLNDFIYFGKGWMNRLNAARQYAGSIGQGNTGQGNTGYGNMNSGGYAPPPISEHHSEREVPDMPEYNPGKGNAPLPHSSELAGAIAAFLHALRNGTGTPAFNCLPPDYAGPTIKAPQAVGVVASDKSAYPVKNALGTTIGNLLDGKKSAIGIVGALVTSMTKGGLLATVPAMLGVSAGTVSGLLPVFLALAAWGGLGKVEKWSGGSK